MPLLFLANDAALVMIEEPGERRRGRVPKIHHCVLFAVQDRVGDERAARLMVEATVRKLRRFAHARAKKPCEHCCRGHAVKAMSVVRDRNFLTHRSVPLAPFLVGGDDESTTAVRFSTYFSSEKYGGRGTLSRASR